MQEVVTWSPSLNLGNQAVLLRDRARQRHQIDEVLGGLNTEWIVTHAHEQDMTIRIWVHPPNEPGLPPRLLRWRRTDSSD